MTTTSASCVLTHISHTYRTEAGDVPVLSDVNISLLPGQFATVVGPSGSGKTTLLSIMGLLLAPSTGSVMIDGVEATELTTNERAQFRADHVSFVFQAFHLIEHLTVAENIALTQTYSSSTQSRVDELIEAVSLTHRANAWPQQLSGGEKQRCAIARALNSEANLLLCDEPTGNLDRENSERVVTTLKDVAHVQGRAVVVITHDRNVAEQSDVIYTIDKGRLRAEAELR
ncbi:ABC transporter ATP-binding protein [Brevibacterium sp. ACRRH]|uniref:ABC transporter ATP-binding protein n=1 Tax=Brevibacterium TaxID=1696 RepID=UPI001EF5145A|nr:ABC transporter ATP-binding protein [Brevibacterium sp. ACRRH]MCG7298830.1 ABC transporter ATP-binding protein [Brevibacterium sp. ACRRH]